MLKNVFLFISGMITMLVIVLILNFVLNKQESEDEGFPGLTIFEQEGACINAKQIKIFQVIAPNVALADALTKPNAIYDENGTFVLILGDENTHYYDDQKINIPSGKCVKQVGTYRYTTKEEIEKTVPAVEIK